MSELTMVAFGTLIFHKLFTNFNVMTKVAFVAIRATSQVLELITWFYFASVMEIRACLSAFTMNKFFADTIFSKLMWIGCNRLILVEIPSIIEFIIVSASLCVIVKVLHRYIVFIVL